MTGADTFRLLNETRSLAAVGWDGAEVPKLWRYNQHYFDDLVAEDGDQRRNWHLPLVSRWIAENPPTAGTGWEPYPTSLRIVNWIKFHLAGQALDPAAVQSLAVQLRWLANRLEWHLLGNHLFANAKALMFGGLLFAGSEAAAWRAVAADILERELPEQILTDGGQFERSPMYHALALEDVLDLLNMLRLSGRPELAALSERLAAIASRMLYWLRCMTFPDGGVTHFNDSADGVAPPTSDIERYAADLGINANWPSEHATVHLEQSGYVRLADGPAVLWFDAAPVGPDYLPGHAHADTLSFELALFDQAVIVNGGTSCYGTDPQRHLERGTASHNTVQIGTHDSSEVWSGFRVGRRARSFDVRVKDGAVEAAHDGYRFLPRQPIHRRSVSIQPGQLTVRDQIDPGCADGCARYHLAPGLVVEPTGPNRWVILHGSDQIAAVEVTHGNAHWESSVHAPEFGLRIQTLALHCKLVADASETRWTWAV